MTQFSDLSLEILFHVFLFLDVPDLVALSSTHPHLHDVVTASPALQFRFAAYNAIAEANQFTRHAPAERLSALERLEDGWSKLDIDFRKTIAIKYRTSTLYDLTAGICVLGDEDRRSLYYCRLPQKPSDEVKWSNIQVDHRIVDFGLAIYEHDLIVVLTLSPNEQYPVHCAAARLLQFSTGNLHPLAQAPVLFVEASNLSHPANLIEIVGNHLVLVIPHPSNRQTLSKDRLYVYQWKTGTLKFATDLPCSTYHGAIFLSPTILCLFNKRMNTLDIWLIPDTPLIPNEPLSPLEPFLSIELPKLSPTYTLDAALCRAEPNPAPSGTPYSSQPFHSISEDSIVSFSFNGIHRSNRGEATFAMFVHRSSLLNLVLAENPDHSADAILGHRNVILPWEKWGLKLARIFRVYDESLRWITTTAGQRCAVDLTWPSSYGEKREQKVTLLDFNPRVAQRLYEESMVTGDPSVLVHFDENVIEHEMFEEPVKTTLPYVSRVLSLKNDSNVPFRAVLLDAERILGIKQKHGYVAEIEVMHFGRLDPAERSENSASGEL
ncbi:hypothetical protein C0992_002704 [Termitomyces sp. T32_za158]|nr:hypothetical protein C0992_002704 [Termitomyces sp. T32_za158]